MRCKANEKMLKECLMPPRVQGCTGEGKTGAQRRIIQKDYHYIFNDAVSCGQCLNDRRVISSQMIRSHKKHVM